jgi:PST family polysaccharide transporter
MPSRQAAFSPSPNETGPLIASGHGLNVGSLTRQAAAAMLARTVVMRAVTALGTIFLARILVPADFGVYALLVLVQNVLMFLADFGIGASLVQQEHEPTQEEMATAWLIQQSAAVVVVVGIWIVSPLLTRQFPSLGHDFEWQLRVVSLSIAFSMIRALPSAMLTRVLRFREIAAVEIVAHLVFYSTAITFALCGGGSWSFVAALTLQMAVAAAMMNLAWRRWPGIGFDRGVARRLLRFGMAFQVANVADEGRDAVVPLFGGLGGGVAAIGYLQFALRISQLTASVDEIIARVAFPAFSRIKGDASRTGRALTDVIVLVSLLIGAPQAWIIATAPHLIPVVFGDQWIPAVPALQFMCLGLLTDVPARITASVVFGQGRSRAGMIATLASVGLLFGLFGPFVLLLGLAGGGLAYAISGAVGLCLLSWTVRSVAHFPWTNLLRVYLLCAVAALPGGLVVSQYGGVLGLALSAAAFGTCYLALLCLFARADLIRAWHLVGADRSPILSGIPRRTGRLSRLAGAQPPAGGPPESAVSTNLPSATKQESE